jgi:hypothetical protein
MLRLPRNPVDGQTSKSTQQMVNDEYLDKKWKEIEERMMRFEQTASYKDKMMLECMVADYEAKMKLKLQDEQ